MRIDMFHFINFVESRSKDKVTLKFATLKYVAEVEGFFISPAS
jgi:hypothetical protein